MARSRIEFTAADFRRLALSFDGAIEGSHMNHPDFRVNGRIFATIHPDDRRGMVKLTPDEQARFVSEHPAMFTPENGAWGRQGCTRVDFGAADRETLGSTGGGLRINLAGVFVFRFDVGKLLRRNFQRVEPGVFTQFFLGWDF